MSRQSWTWPQRATALTTGAAAVLLVSGSTGIAQGLFRPTTAPEASVAASEQGSRASEIERKGIVTLDPHYLRSRLTPEGTERLSDAQREALIARLPPEVDLQLFPDVSLKIRRDGPNDRSKGPASFFWGGASVPPRDCYADFMIARGIFSGELRCLDVGVEYVITHLNDNQYEVLERRIAPELPDAEGIERDQPLREDAAD